MEDYSALYPKQLRIQCCKAIEIIDKENTAYSNLISELKNRIIYNNNLSGDAIDTIKDYAYDFIMVIERLIEANNLDREDNKELINALDTVMSEDVDIDEVLWGEQIHKEIQSCEISIKRCKDMLESLEPNNLGEIIGKLLSGNLICELKTQIEDKEREIEDLENKEKRYDIIESETKILFSDSEEIRNLANEALAEIEAGFSFDGVSYVYISPQNNDWKNQFAIMELNNKYPEIYSFLSQLRDENNNTLYTDEQIVDFWLYFKNKKTDMFMTFNYLKEHNSGYYKTYNDILKEEIAFWAWLEKERNITGIVGTQNDPLTNEQIEENAEYIYVYLYKKGWSKNAILALLGNIDEESGFNPGVWQDLNNEYSGYGLLQFTAYEGVNEFFDYLKDEGYGNYEDYNALIETDPKQMLDYQLEFLLTGKGWYYSNTYLKNYSNAYNSEDINTIEENNEFSFAEFQKSSLNCKVLALMFEASYERSGDDYLMKIERSDSAEKWCNYFDDVNNTMEATVDETENTYIYE